MPRQRRTLHSPRRSTALRNPLLLGDADHALRERNPSPRRRPELCCLKCKLAPMQGLCTPREDIAPQKSNSRPQCPAPPSYVANSSKGRPRREAPGRAGRGPPCRVAPPPRPDPGNLRRRPLLYSGVSTRARPAESGAALSIRVPSSGAGTLVRATATERQRERRPGFRNGASANRPQSSSRNRRRTSSAKGRGSNSIKSSAHTTAARRMSAGSSDAVVSSSRTGNAPP